MQDMSGWPATLTCPSLPGGAAFAVARDLGAAPVGQVDIVPSVQQLQTAHLLDAETEAITHRQGRPITWGAHAHH